MQVAGNEVLSRGGNVTSCGMPLVDWVKAGHDKGTTVGVWPQDAALVARVREMLGF